MKNVNQPLPLNPKIVRPNGNWRRLAELTTIFGVHRRTLTLWCENGTFRDFGYEVYKHPTGWLVNVPPELMSKNPSQV